MYILETGGNYLKLIFKVCLVLVSLLTAMGCTEDPQDNTKDSEITVLVVDQGRTPYGIKVNDLIIKGKSLFEQNNPSTKINLVTVPENEYQKKMEELSPDVFWIALNDFEKYEKQGLLDLTPFIKKDQLNINDYFSSNLMNLTTVKGKPLGIVFASINRVVGYSKEWFDKAKLPYPKDGWTWEEFADTAKKLKDANGSGSGTMYGAIIPFNSEYLEPLVMSKGGSYLSPDGSTAKGYLNSKQTIDSFRWVMDLAKNKIIPPLTGSQIANISNKLGTETGMTITYIADIVTLNSNPAFKDKFGMVGLPKFKEGIRVSAPIFTAIGISAKTKNPDLAWKYVSSFAMEPNEVTKEAYKMEVNISKKVFESLQAENDPSLTVGMLEQNYTQRRSSMKTKEWQNILNQYARNDFENLLISNRDPEQTLSELASKIEQSLIQAKNKEEQSKQ
jgi:multiple sugar transport system substrate-binding protein